MILLCASALSLTVGLHDVGVLPIPRVLVFGLSVVLIAFLPGLASLRHVMKLRSDIATYILASAFGIPIVSGLVALPGHLFGGLVWWIPVLMVDAFLLFICLVFCRERVKSEQTNILIRTHGSTKSFVICATFVAAYFILVGSYFFEYTSLGLVTRPSADGDMAFNFAVVQEFMKGVPARNPFLAGEVEPWKSFSAPFLFYATVLQLTGIPSAGWAVESLILLNAFANTLLASVIFWICRDMSGDDKGALLAMLAFALGTSAVNITSPGIEGLLQVTKQLFFCGGTCDGKGWVPGFVISGANQLYFYGFNWSPSLIFMLLATYFVGKFWRHRSRKYFYMACYFAVSLAFSGQAGFLLYFVICLYLLCLLMTLGAIRSPGRGFVVVRITCLAGLMTFLTLFLFYWQLQITGVRNDVFNEHLFPPFQFWTRVPLSDAAILFATCLGFAFVLGLVGTVKIVRRLDARGLALVTLLAVSIFLFSETNIFSPIHLYALIVIGTCTMTGIAISLLQHSVAKRRYRRILIVLCVVLLFSFRTAFFGSFLGQYYGELHSGSYPIAPFNSYRDSSYISTCDWVRSNTPEDSVFLTVPDEPFFPMLAGRQVVFHDYTYYRPLDNYRDANRVYELMRVSLGGEGWSGVRYSEGKPLRMVTSFEYENATEASEFGYLPYFSVTLDATRKDHLIEIEYLDEHPPAAGFTTPTNSTAGWRPTWGSGTIRLLTDDQHSWVQYEGLSDRNSGIFTLVYDFTHPKDMRGFDALYSYFWASERVTTKIGLQDINFRNLWWDRVFQSKGATLVTLPFDGYGQDPAFDLSLVNKVWFEIRGEPSRTYAMRVSSGGMLPGSAIDVIAYSEEATRIATIRLDGTHKFKTIVLPISIEPKMSMTKAGVYESYFGFSGAVNLPISEITVPSNLATVIPILNKYHVEYIVVGEAEKAYYHADFFSFAGVHERFEKVYVNYESDLDIYRVWCYNQATDDG